MTETQRAAMQAALKALEMHWDMGIKSDWEISKLRAALAEQQEHEDALVAWQQEGERIFDSASTGFSFKLGVWWADRPWRVK